MFAGWLLADMQIDRSFNLGEAKPKWLRFETEAPVDDILVATTNDGFVAIQAKTTVSSSQDIASPFGKTIEQFVRQWFVCRDGDGSLEWNRPLDWTKDRLVLATGPESPAAIRTHLPAALALARGPGQPLFSKNQRDAFDDFRQCVQTTWPRLTSEPFDDRILQELAQLICIFTFDPAAVAAMLTSGSQIVEGDAIDALQTALSDFCEELMVRRGGADLPALRQALMTRNVPLKAAPRFSADIAALRRHSSDVSQALSRYESIQSGGEMVGIARDCQVDVERAAMDGSLLIVGEPGAGKSGVLNALATKLKDDKYDVVVLAVDRYSVESLEGLSKELRLDHGLIETLEAWDGREPAFLIIDALDATRGGRGEGVFRSLIETMVKKNARWRVIASIRTFDLQMGQQLRALFKGTPPNASLSERAFAAVRHIKIPLWSSSEFERLRRLAPALDDFLKQTSDNVRDLATVPFNTRLLAELIADGVVSNDVAGVVSQTGLLNLYWDHRVQTHGLGAESCLRRIVDAMVASRSLRAARLEVASPDPDTLQRLMRDGVLISVEGERWIQFRHHLLFDYTASRLFIDPYEIAAGRSPFSGERGLGLMLSPAMAFALHELWSQELDRDRFWQAVVTLLGDDTQDTIIRSIASRVASELPEFGDDVMRIAAVCAEGDKKALKALSHVVGALAVRAEDGLSIAVPAWATAVAILAKSAEVAEWPLRVLIYLLISRPAAQDDRAKIGSGSRALLRYGLGVAENNNVVVLAIGAVADTYATNPHESHALLSEVLAPERLARFASSEAPAVARKIKAIALSDPEFAAQIYRIVYSREIAEDQETDLSRSQILALRSSSRQDFEMARYSLSEHFPEFLVRSPSWAVKAFVSAVCGYVDREHPGYRDYPAHPVEVAGKSYLLQEDHSYIWAHDPEASYGGDGETLVASFLRRLRDAPEAEALVLAEEVMKTGALGIYWSRLFMAAAGRHDALTQLLWQFAILEPFLVSPDTRKDAIDLVRSGLDGRPDFERVAFEKAALDFGFAEYPEPERARAAFLERLFQSIGAERLLTAEAKEIASHLPDDADTTNGNPRIFRLTTFSEAVPRYHWLDGFDETKPDNAALAEATDVVKKLFDFDKKDGAKREPPAADFLEALTRFDTIVVGLPSAHAGLREHAEAVLAECLSKLIDCGLAPQAGDEGGTREMLRLLQKASAYKSPSVDTETEARFEDSNGWGSPAGRLEAAEASLDWLQQRPDLYDVLLHLADGFIRDPHPAVRLQTVLRLPRLLPLSPDAFWERIGHVARTEENLGVLDFVASNLLGHLISHDPVKVEVLATAILARFDEPSARADRVREHIAPLLAILWVTYQRSESKAIIDGWLLQPRCLKASAKVLATLRGALVHGLQGEAAGTADIRQRAHGIFVESVHAAKAVLDPYFDATDAKSADSDRLKAYAELLDVASREIFFSVKSRRDDAIVLGEGNRTAFFREIEPILVVIGSVGTPHTIYYLLQLLEALIPTDPARVFDVAAIAILQGGRRTGYQNESMGADLMVRMVGQFLADHKEIFEDDDRRMALIKCLELFMDAGWPAARRLLFRLPDLFQ
ncbi:ATP-binding protein [Rhizobium aethiopicum]|uniref:ATP-binding protein n=1 Tax=Rhizobium aethiopicum TaxID=1138170 RepID=UPI00113001FF|nr:ATP-binding protein [Rhizobium aethiopicum]